MILQRVAQPPGGARGALFGALARQLRTRPDAAEPPSDDANNGAAHDTSMANEPAPAQDPATLIARITQDLATLRQTLAERPTPTPEPPPQPKLMLTVEEAGHLIGVSRTVMYDLIGDGSIQSVKIGSLRRVPRVALDAYVAKLSDHQAAS